MWSKANESWMEGATPHLRMGPPLNGRPQHLIEAAKRGRLNQMLFFSVPLTTRAQPKVPDARPDVRPDVAFQETCHLERFLRSVCKKSS